MLLPVDLESKVFKSGINGYDKKDVDTFMLEVHADYDTLYKDNNELMSKVEHLTEALNQYKGIEKSLQRALVLAQKASDDVKEQANQQAKLIEEEARYKAKMIIADANTQLDQMQSQTLTLLRQFELYKAQYKQLVSTQLDILSGDSFNIDMARFSNLSLPPSQDFEKAAQASSQNHETDVQNENLQETYTEPHESKESITKNEVEHKASHGEGAFENMDASSHADEDIQIQDLDKQLNQSEPTEHISSDTTIQIKMNPENIDIGDSLNPHYDDTPKENTDSSKEYMAATGEDGLLAPITRHTTKTKNNTKSHSTDSQKGYYDMLSEIYGDKDNNKEDQED